MITIKQFFNKHITDQKEIEFTSDKRWRGKPIVNDDNRDLLEKGKFKDTGFQVPVVSSNIASPDNPQPVDLQVEQLTGDFTNIVAIATMLVDALSPLIENPSNAKGKIITGQHVTVSEFFGTNGEMIL